MNYYNDNDPFACEWARNLIQSGEVPDGVVDQRSIEQVQPADLRGYHQCHFFSGILGWPLALKLAGWPEDRPVWSGSCPCQPFSQAGKGKGIDDERHLWPEFLRLIRECHPECVLGEQVANAIGKGWLDGISTDLEKEGYAVGAVVLGAHSAGLPHIRQRLFWVADAEPDRHQGGIPAEGEASSMRRRFTEQGAEGDGLSNAPELRQQGRSGAEQPILGFRPDGADVGSGCVYCRDGKTRRVPGPQWEFFKMVDGIPTDLGYNESGLCGVDDSPGRTHEGSVNEDMRTVRKNAEDEKEIQRKTRRQSSIRPSSVLQQEVHDERNGGDNQETQSAVIPPTVSQNGEVVLRVVQPQRHVATCSPQGLQSTQQQRVQFDYCVRLLPSSLTLTKLRGWHEATKALQDLREAIYKAGSVRHASRTLEEVWRSLNYEDMGRIRLDFANRVGIVCSLAPLAFGIPRKLGPPLTGMGQVGIRAARANRVGRLKGYGNAIVPQVAAEFIKAYMEAKDLDNPDEA